MSLEVLLLLLSCLLLSFSARVKLNMKAAVRPCAAATWDFGAIAVARSRDNLMGGSDSLTAVELGVNAVELDLRDQYFVGYGGLPNAKGVMELDAAIMDHECRYGAVMALRDIRTPISVARTVLEKSPHNIFVGEGALEWALSQNFERQNVLTEQSKQEWEAWKATQVDKTPSSHDTVGLICLDDQGRLSAGTSTSGWKFKHPGRVGDSPLMGGGLYCDGTVGAAVATGDGEEIMRTCLCFLVVEYMRNGASVGEACRKGIERLRQLKPLHTFQGQDAAVTCSGGVSTQDTMHPSLVVGVVAMDKHGNVGAASTLGVDNPHRGEPYFPVSCWRAGSIVEADEGNSDMYTLKASLQGAEYSVE